MFLRDWSAAARYGGPGIVLGLALAWSLSGLRGVQAQAASPGSIERPRPVAGATAGEAGGVLAMISPFQAGTPGSSGNTASQLLYLIDTKSRSFAVYRIDPAHPKGTIKLEGARQFQWDMKLQEHNNQEPYVRDIESFVNGTHSPKR